MTTAEIFSAASVCKGEIEILFVEFLMCCPGTGICHHHRLFLFSNIFFCRERLL